MKLQIEKIKEDVTEIKVTLERNTVILEHNTESLKEHMARTQQNEDEIKDLRKFQYLLLGGLMLVQVLIPILVKLLL